MIDIWALVCTPSVVSALGDQIYLFVCILCVCGKKTLELDRQTDQMQFLTKVNLGNYGFFRGLY